MPPVPSKGPSASAFTLAPGSHKKEPQTGTGKNKFQQGKYRKFCFTNLVGTLFNIPFIKQ